MKRKLALLCAALMLLNLTGCNKEVGPAVTTVDYGYKQQLEPQEVVSSKTVQPVVVDETKVDPDESYSWKALRDRLGISFLEESEIQRIFDVTSVYDFDKSGKLETEYITEPLKGSDDNLYLYIKGDYYQCDENGFVELNVVNCEALNFRVGPSTGNEIIGKINKGNSTWVKASAHMSDGSTWYRVKNKDGQLGWQHSYYLQLSANAIKKPAEIDIVPAVEVNADGEIVVSYPEFDNANKSLTAAYVFTEPAYLKHTCLSCGQTPKDCADNGCKTQVLGKKTLKEGEERIYYKNFDEVKEGNQKAKREDYGWFWIDTEEEDNCYVCSHSTCIEGLPLEYVLALDKAEKTDKAESITLKDETVSETEETAQAKPQEAHEYVDIKNWPYFTEGKTAADKLSDFYWPQTVKRFQDEKTIVFDGAGFHNEQIDLNAEDLVLLKVSTDLLNTTSKSPYDPDLDETTRQQMLDNICGYVLLDNAEIWALVPLFEYSTGKVIKHGWVYVTTLLSAEDYIQQSYHWLRFFEDYGYTCKTFTAEEYELLGLSADDAKEAEDSFIGNSRLTDIAISDIWLSAFNFSDTVTTYKERYVIATLNWLNNLKRETALQ